MLIQLTNPKVLGLLHEMEKLNLIKILKNDEINLYEKYEGKLPSSFGDKLQNYVTRGRDEWNNKSRQLGLSVKSTFHKK
ncbi:MAG: hypothetical protein ABI723_14490 [Bacteroidia bacterium]